MRYIASTAEVLALKMLGKSIDKKWVDWAYNMLVAGYETDNLLILAGETKPYDQFELQGLTDKILNELELAWDNAEQVHVNYIGYLVSEALAGNIELYTALNSIKDIYYALDRETGLEEFCMLYWAYNDLQYSYEQWYWDGATRENISLIIREYFTKWMAGDR